MKINKEYKLVLRTRKVGSYFSGKIKKWDNEWHVMCSSYAGGNVDILQILDFKAKTKKQLLAQLRKFKSKHKLISTDK